MYKYLSTSLHHIFASKFNSSKSTGVAFRSLDTVDFRYSSSLDPMDITVYEYNGSTPTFYLLKKAVNCIAGTIETEEFSFGSAKKYDSRFLATNDVTDIISVKDSDGNNWYEVPYLAQDTVFVDMPNNDKNNPIFIIVIIILK